MLRPLVVLLVAVAGGFGMWHALMQDRGGGRAAGDRGYGRERLAVEQAHQNLHP